MFYKGVSKGVKWAVGATLKWSHTQFGIREYICGSYHHSQKIQEKMSRWMGRNDIECGLNVNELPVLWQKSECLKGVKHNTNELQCLMRSEVSSCLQGGPEMKKD